MARLPRRVLQPGLTGSRAVPLDRLRSAAAGIGKIGLPGRRLAGMAAQDKPGLNLEAGERRQRGAIRLGERDPLR